MEGKKIEVFMALYYDLPVFKDVYSLTLKHETYEKKATAKGRKGGEKECLEPKPSCPLCILWVEPGGYPPGAPTDPDMPNFRTAGPADLWSEASGSSGKRFV
jgi:hypothetical protein